jgi:hypothetical protein
MDADLLQASLDIAAQLVGRPKLQPEAKAQPGQQGRVDAHLQTGQELFVADQQQAEGRLGVAAVATQKPHFLQGGGAQVLRFVDDQDRPEPVQLLPTLSDEQHIVAAAHPRRLPQFGAEQTQQIGAGD